MLQQLIVMFLWCASCRSLFLKGQALNLNDQESLMATVKPAILPRDMTEDYEEHFFDPEWQENAFRHSAKASPLTMLMQCEILTNIFFDQIQIKMEIFRIVVHHMVQIYYIIYREMFWFCWHVCSRPLFRLIFQP